MRPTIGGPYGPKWLSQQNQELEETMSCRHASLVLPMFIALFFSINLYGQQKFDPELHDEISIQNDASTIIKIQVGWHGLTDWSDHYIDPGQSIKFNHVRNGKYPVFLFGIYDGRAGDKANYRTFRKSGAKNPLQVKITGVHGNFTPIGENVSPGHWQKDGGWVRYHN